MREFSPSLRPLLAQAEAFAARSASHFADHLAGAVGGGLSPRVTASVDLLLGRTQLYLQQPSMFLLRGPAAAGVFRA